MYYVYLCIDTESKKERHSARKKRAEYREQDDRKSKQGKKL